MKYGQAEMLHGKNNNYMFEEIYKNKKEIEDLIEELEKKENIIDNQNDVIAKHGEGGFGSVKEKIDFSELKIYAVKCFKSPEK